MKKDLEKRINMKIYSVYDKEFMCYGKVIKNYDVSKLCSLLHKFPITDEVNYVASDKELESTEFAKELADGVFGGMKTQLGCCYGKNTKLNALEYHRSSEINLSDDDFILLLAKEWEIQDGKLDTSKVKAFLCPKGTMINVYATTLHYAPCSSENGKGFSVMVALPYGTNTDYKLDNLRDDEDKLLWARNKWLISHKDSGDAKNGAYVGLIGENIDIKSSIK